MRKFRTKDGFVFKALAYFLISVLTVICVLPFILVISGSFTQENAIITRGYGLLPVPASLEAYKYIFNYGDQVSKSYLVSIFVTITGALFGLFLCTMTAYVLYRKDFKLRNRFSFFFYFTTLFNGGLVSYYILMISYLQLRNNYLALILPGLLPVFYILVMRSFINSMIPDSMIESAKIDGSGDFNTYAKIVLPLLKPALASIGLFYLIGYWNDWSNAMLFISDTGKYPLQYLLTTILNKQNFLSQQAVSSAAVVNQVKLPSESFKLAMTVISIGPIALAYPFLQKYFVSGMTIGAVKG